MSFEVLEDRTLLSTVSIISTADTTDATEVSLEWVQQFAATKPAGGSAHAVDANGDIYLTGDTDGIFAGQTTAGGRDAFVMKLDPSGNLLWTKQFGTSGADVAHSIAADSSGVYVAGYTGGTFAGETGAGYSDAFVTKLDFSGNLMWTEQFGTSGGDSAHGIAADSSGVYVTGDTSGTFAGETSSGGADAFVTKLDSSGNLLWTQQFGTSSREDAHGIAADSSGVYVAGYTSGTFSGETNAGSADAFVTKLDSSGSLLWTEQFGTSGGDYARGIAADGSGVYVTGYTSGTFADATNAGSADAFVIKLDSSGSLLWTEQFGTSSQDLALAIATDHSGIYVTGRTSGTFAGQTSAGERDAFVSKVDRSGDLLWTEQLGTSSYDAAFGITADSSGVYVTGSTNGTFSGETNTGSADVFVAKLRSPFVVTSTGDSGPGTLRQAILDANANPGVDTITFALSTLDRSGQPNPDFEDIDGDGNEDVFVIRPLTPLPALDDSSGGTTIDGFSQAYVTGDTNPLGPEVVLDGSLIDPALTDADGLRVASDHSEIRGLNIQQFSRWGILITGEGVRVYGNYIGTDATGATPRGNGGGMRVQWTTDVQIGGTHASQRNVVSGNEGSGIHIQSAPGTVVQGNFIGVDALGTEPLGNLSGVTGGSNGVVIGGTAAGAGNVISANADSGIRAGGDLVVQGNFIGTDVTGKQALGNRAFGVHLQGANALIGGTEPGAGNVISANGFYGIQAVNTTNIRVQGNLLGTDVTGSTIQDSNGNLLGTKLHAGVQIHGGSGAVIGGTDAAARNIISGNDVGVDIRTTDAVVQGNYIGTDITGSFPLGNWTGIYIGPGATGNQVGGSAEGAGNVIAASSGRGVNINRASDNVLQGNLIGLAADGRASAAAGWARASDPQLLAVTGMGNHVGIALLANSASNVVGADGDGAEDQDEGNLISSNDWLGILLEGDANTIAGNGIGLDATGDAAGNGQHGVWLNHHAEQNLLRENVISGNGGDGVWIAGSENVLVDNVIGVDPTGQFARANGGHGVLIQNRHTTAAPTSNRIEGNLISANTVDGVHIADSMQTIVAGNYIGIDATGSIPLGNGENGVEIRDGSQGTIIGTNGDGVGDSEEGNVVSANGHSGIWNVGAPGTVVAGNFIGTDAHGHSPLGNSHKGVGIVAGSHGSRLGTNGDGVSDEWERNVVADNRAADGGVVVFGSNYVEIAGNYVGTDATGTLDRGNSAAGIVIRDSRFVTVGTDGAGNIEAARNVITGNGGDNIRIEGIGTQHNVVAGNYIGTNADGSAAMNMNNDSIGVNIIGGASDNIIGTNGDSVGDVGEGNVISGHGNSGIRIAGVGTNNNILAGNHIGIDAIGAQAIPNGRIGVVLAHGAESNRIGTDGNGVGDLEERNIISGNGIWGLEIFNAHRNVVAGNFVGTDVTGNAALPQGSNGIVVYRGSHDNLIGTDGDGVSDALERNVVSGNGRNGVQIANSGTANNHVAGNYIGLNADGTLALGNGNQGIAIFGGASNNLVGVDDAALNPETQRNVISGNAVMGINMVGDGTNHNVIAGNYIGTDASGVSAVGNVAHGILVWRGPQNNRIGTDSNGLADDTESNLIAFNGKGVVVEDPSTSANTIRGNSIHSNDGLGIDLGDDGVTTNDSGDADTGPNGLQNFPVIERALITGPATEVIGSINSTPETTLTLDFYASTTADATGHGEAERWLGSTTIATDESGAARFVAVLSSDAEAGDWITATATGPEGTSEFSAGETAILLVETNAPGSGQLAVNLNHANRAVPIAVLTTETFDAASVEVSTVAFAGAGISDWSLEDVDGDGDLDLLMRFRVEDANLIDVYEDLVRDDLIDGTLDSAHQHVEVSLTGKTKDGLDFIGFEALDLFMSGSHLDELMEEL